MADLASVHDIISFRIVREPYGWAVRMGDGVMTPFESRQLALQHAQGFADVLRGCGERVEVVCDEEAASRPRPSLRRTRFPSIWR